VFDYDSCGGGDVDGDRDKAGKRRKVRSGDDKIEASKVELSS